jgi:arylsulfatase A-like enzyme
MYRPEDIVPRKNWQPGVQRGGSVKDIAGYYAAIACLDGEIGRLLKRLDESGLRDNTMVLFLSDHGDLLGSHGSIRKQKPWEESVVVPGLLRWPAALKAGVTSEALVSHVDVVPTLLGLCGVRPTVKMHGFDYARHLRSGRGRTPERAHLAIYTKTELNQYDAWRGLRTRKYKYARFKERPWVLYDLEKDPYELENLVESPSMRPAVERFDREIEQFMRRTGDGWDELQHRPYV